jgi:uncharacterized protein YndB with AHSA1/START domain
MGMDESKAKSNAISNSNSRELFISRVFDAPRELVWKVWTEPEHVMQWWGPKVFTSPFCSIDLRVGGSYLYCMRSPEGQDFWSTGVYREIVPLERIVATDSFADEKGNVVPASYYGMSADWPLQMIVTVMFEEQDGKTKFTLKYPGTEGISETDLADMKQGWNESLDKLAEYLGKL